MEGNVENALNCGARLGFVWLRVKSVKCVKKGSSKVLAWKLLTGVRWAKRRWIEGGLPRDGCWRGAAGTSRRMGTRKTDGKNNEIDEGQRRRNLAPKSYAADE